MVNRYGLHNTKRVRTPGLKDQGKPNLVFELLRKGGNDTVLLQKTYSTSDVKFCWSNERRKTVIWNSGTNNARGIAILVYNDHLAIKHVLCNDEGRAIAIDFNADGEYFHLVNLHAPVGGVNSVYVDQEMFFGSVHRLIFSKYPTLN